MTLHRALKSRGLALVTRPEREEALLWLRLRADDAGARERLFMRHVGLARMLARRHGLKGRDLASREDTDQHALTGLLEAIDRFDPHRGVPFSAFARQRIIGAIRDGNASSTEIDAQRSRARRRDRDRLASLSGPEPGDDGDALAKLARVALGLAVGMMLEGTGMLVTPDAHDERPDPYQTLAWCQMKQKLTHEVGRLPAKEASVIRLHYGEGLAFLEVARLMALSPGRISQLHKAALATLRRRIGRKGELV